MKEREKILVIDDEKHLLEVIKFGLEEKNYTVDDYSNPAEAIKRFKDDIFDAVITDIKMPEMSGLEVLKECKEISPRVVVILITAYSSVESAIQAIRGGASDYITKPFRMEELLLRLDEALKKVKMEEMVDTLRKEKLEEYELIGISKEINDIKEKLKKVSQTGSAVFITGESGTGKELVANIIHYSSGRTGKFVPVNCAAFPPDLLESELFGYRKGAFTGADKDKEGLFKVADRGTLFLDEISTLPLKLQPKLLRAIQTMSYTPLGGTKQVRVNLRLVTATNKDIEKMIERKEFREDLYYRINVIPIYIPPLRERIEDIPYLVDHFIKKISERLNVKEKQITEKALNILSNRDWKGNIRELENLIERIIVMEDSDIITENSIPKVNIRFQFSDTLNLQKLEREAIIRALKVSDFDKKRASKMLGIHPSTLYRKIKKLKINELDIENSNGKLNI